MRTPPLRAAARGARRLGLPLLTVVPAALALQAGSAFAADTTRYLTFSGCGGTGGITGNEFRVPAGVTRMDVIVVGDTGGGEGGGLGAEVSGTISVTPGSTLYGCVSEGGANGGDGFVGDGGSGGGYALLSSSSDLSSPFAIAGGGGGAGGNTGGTGGNAGLPGANARDGQTMGVGGAGGGRGANAGGAGSAGINLDGSSANGRAGTIRRGGLGGNGDVGGGGGGGGVWGGGGGAGSVEVGNGAGGGGGSSYCDMGASCSSQLTDGGSMISLTYALPDTTTTTTAAVSDPAPNRGAALTYTATVNPVPTGGTVNFNVGGYDVWGCDAVAVDTTTGVARCEANAHYAPGPQTLTTSYSGTTGFTTSRDEEQFTVRAGAVSVSPSPRVDYGSVELGKQGTQVFTVTNTGDGPLTIEALDGIYVAEYEPRAMPPRSLDFHATDDQCSDRTLAPNATCNVTIAFAPTVLGERTAELLVLSDAWSSDDEVKLTGVGIAPAPEPRPEPRPDPTPTPDPAPNPQPQPQPAPVTPVTPATPAAPAPVAPKPAATTPAPAPAPSATPAPVGASVALPASRGAQVSQTGSVRLPLVCPTGQPCRVSGVLTLALTGGQARAAQSTKTRVLVRFSGIKIAAGKTRSLSLRLPASFVKAQQKKGVRKLRTSLTVRTTLGSGRVITRRQAITLLIPRARVAQRPAATPAPSRPVFTG